MNVPFFVKKTGEAVYHVIHFVPKMEILVDGCKSIDCGSALSACPASDPNKTFCMVLTLTSSPSSLHELRKAVKQSVLDAIQQIVFDQDESLFYCDLEHKKTYSLCINKDKDSTGSLSVIVSNNVLSDSGIGIQDDKVIETISFYRFLKVIEADFRRCVRRAESERVLYKKTVSLLDAGLFSGVKRKTIKPAKKVTKLDIPNIKSIITAGEEIAIPYDENIVSFIKE